MTAPLARLLLTRMASFCRASQEERTKTAAPEDLPPLSVTLPSEKTLCPPMARSCCIALPKS